MNTEFFTRRATVRAYDKEKELTDAELESLIYAASHAPTLGNMQLYSVVVSRKPEAVAHLAKLHLGQPAAANCSALLTICADIRRFGKWCSARDAKSGLDNLGGWFMAITDAAIFGQQFVTAAEMNGLGCCYLGSLSYNVDGFKEALGIPEGVLPLYSISVGYPQGEVPAPADRLPLEGIMHRERYSDYSDADIDRIYGPKEALPSSAQFIAENGKETLAQVFADVRYPESLIKSVSDAISPIIDK